MKRFFECLVPVTACNLRCDYCYVIQENRNSNKILPFKYKPEELRAALSKSRLGGECFFSFCGAGETLFHPELPKLVSELLSEGHYINITTNGSFTKGVENVIRHIDTNFAKHLLFSFSLHYVELLKRNLLEVFKNNVEFVRKAGCSILIQFNLYDGYLPYLEEIKKFCLDNFGALPQVAATRKEEGKISLYTDMDKCEYVSYGRDFCSPLFEITIENFNHPCHDYCYAGKWSYVMNLERGVIKPCYCNGKEYDIFENIECDLPISVVGKHCGNVYCINSSHFLSLGVVPSRYKDVTYASLRNREEAEWFSEEIKTFLNRKLEDDNKEDGVIKMWWNEMNYLTMRAKRKISKYI